MVLVYRRAQDNLADLVSPDGRPVYSKSPKHIYFADEPDRILELVED